MSALIMTPDELKARKRRNMWLGLAIAGFMLLVFAITMAKVGAAILDRPL
ncbi:hypothetical protein [Terricaulis sp.]